MTAPQPAPRQQSTRQSEVRLGDQECPRCHQSFTLSYWLDGVLVQARCLSCELKWPLPKVV
jgi:Zn ribbon nucleic-acid-binding protein